VRPFELSSPTSITVPAPSGPSRLAVWFEDEAGVALARTFVDAAPIEPPNRRGARAH
jgi:hypothetical protein